MTLAFKLATRLNDQFGYCITKPENCKIRRTHAGHNQLSAGAWSCFLEDENGFVLVGWNGSLEKLLRSPELVVYTNRIGDSTLMKD